MGALNEYNSLVTMSQNNTQNQETKEVSSPSKTSNNGELDPGASEIKEVWEDNFEEEMDKVQELLEKYHCVAMDTEFPGVCYQGENITGYSLIKTNVDALKLIQVGISLADKDGNKPQPISTWQFNLRFDLKNDQYSQESIAMLQEAGIGFEELAEKGIDPLQFADGLTSSGLILNEEVQWVTFHGAFDFAYLIKVLTNGQLPATLEKFKTVLKLYFPSVADIKVIMKEVQDLKSGALAKLARDLDLKRIGTMHQAGSDAEITLRCFLKLKEDYFKTGISPKLLNKVFGLNNEYQQQNQPLQVNPQPQAPVNKEVPRFNIYQQYPGQHLPAYYPYNGADFHNGYYYNQIEMPMMYTTGMTPAMASSDYSAPFKL
jgi:CCR4-NOT transcription complex subunit 7/8